MITLDECRERLKLIIMGCDIRSIRHLVDMPKRRTQSEIDDLTKMTQEQMPALKGVSKIMREILSLPEGEREIEFENFIFAGIYNSLSELLSEIHERMKPFITKEREK